MPSCSIFGGCKHPDQHVGGHVCKACLEPVHNMCLQALTGVEDKPEGGFVCGSGGMCRKDVGHTSGLAERILCTAGRKCLAPEGTTPTSVQKCCGRVCHLRCTRLGCIHCDAPGSEEGSESIPRSSSRDEAIDVDSLPTGSSPDVPSNALAKKQSDASMLLSMSSAMKSTKDTISPQDGQPPLSNGNGDVAVLTPPPPGTGVIQRGVQPSTPAPSTAKKITSATPTRESSRIRAQTARDDVSPSVNSVALDPVSTNKIIGGALNDAFGTLYKSPPYIKALTTLVKENSFKEAVAAVSEKLPITKAQLKRITADNSVTVHGMLSEALVPQLGVATQGITEATTTMKVVVETLKAAIATETPVEVKRSGRKGKGKKGAKSDSLDPSGEEDVLLTSKDIAQLVAAFNDTNKGAMKDTLCEGVLPHFAGLAKDVAGAINSSTTTTRGLARDEHTTVVQALCTIQKTLADVTVSLAEVKAQCFEHAKALGLLPQASDTRDDTRRRASSSSATASRMAGKRGSRSSSYDPSSSDNSEESRTPEVKRNKKRPTSLPTSKSIHDSDEIKRQLQTLLDRGQQNTKRNPEQDSDANIAQQVRSLLGNKPLQSQQPQVIIAQATHPSMLQGGLGLPPMQQPTAYPSYATHFR